MNREVLKTTRYVIIKDIETISINEVRKNIHDPRYRIVSAFKLPDVVLNISRETNVEYVTIMDVVFTVQTHNENYYLLSKIDVKFPLILELAVYLKKPEGCIE